VVCWSCYAPHGNRSTFAIAILIIQNGINMNWRSSGLVTLFLLLSAVGWTQGFGTKELISSGWKFNLGDLRFGEVEYLDHSKWRSVDLPHDWSIEQAASKSLASCTGYLPGGIGWYRKDLDISANHKDEKVYIYFEGVYNNSEVYVNGKWVGKRPNGYISFMYDITPYVNFGGRNVVAVKVNHSEDADSRWYTGSGIYRDVYLVYANRVHVDLWGVHYKTEVQQGKANVWVATDVVNDGSEPCTVKVVNQLVAADGKVVGASTTTSMVGVGESKAVSQQFEVANPALWSVKSPNLYKLRTEVFKGDVKVDASETRVGIRTLSYDANRGFALNGEWMKVKGVCLHHDAGCLGAAVPRDVWERRLKQLKEIGCNAIRMSHNPQATCVYDLCDELGLLVMDEAFDEWEYPKKKWLEGWNVGTPGFQGSYKFFYEWGKRDLADMIKRDRNHPCIIMWSIGNEVDYPNDPYSHPVLNKEGIGQHHEHGYKTDLPRAERIGDIAKMLVAEVKKYDVSRPVTGAMAGAVMSNETEYPGTLDIVGYNYTEYKYKQDHKTYPNRVIYGSETRHDFNAWKAVRDNEFIFGQFIWTGFDYLGEAGPWPSRGFISGMIDLSGNIKPRGYFRRSLWFTEPTAYIGTYPLASNRGELSTDAPAVWNYENGDTIRVVAYTNCREAELLLNGKQVGARKAYDDAKGIISWDIPYKPGKLEVVGFNKGVKATTYAIQSSGRPYALKVSVDKQSLKGNGAIAHLDIKVVDEKGVEVVLADNVVTCKLEGPARLLGLESGSPLVTDNYRDNVQRCFNGKLLGYIQATGKGKIVVKVTSPLLKDAGVVVAVD